ncbi:MAG: hypothetical protein ABSA75_00720, partial [Candidatus Bathyarchaeia archaeon]
TALKSKFSNRSVGEPDLCICINKTRSGSPNINGNYLIRLRTRPGYQIFNNYIKFKNAGANENELKNDRKTKIQYKKRRKIVRFRDHKFGRPLR